MPTARRVAVTLAGLLTATLLVAGQEAAPTAAVAPYPAVVSDTASDTVSGAAPARCPWLDRRLSPDARATMLVGAMTTEQKVGMLHGPAFTFLTHYGTAGHIPAIPELCVPELALNDAGNGLGDFQVGTTAYPVGIAQASTWNRALQRRLGRAMGWEARTKGIGVLLGPAVNINRHPLNGRNFEYAGEDPYLAGETGVQVARGLRKRGIIGSLKHYALNQQETDRMTSSSEVGDRALREIYLPAMEAVVKRGHVGSVMCSYNKIGGTWACENERFMTEILRRDWGFKGFVVSDWNATHSTAKAANAGLDLEMAATSFEGKYFGDPMLAAVADGDVPRWRLDQMVHRITRTMFAHGLFDNPVATQPEAFATVSTSDARRAVARRVSEQGSVLLKNRGALPLPGAGGHTIAVIGTPSTPAGAQVTYNGGGSSKVNMPGTVQVVSPLEGITARAAAAGDVVVPADGTLMADAVAAAAASDVAVVVAADYSIEMRDKPDLRLRFGICNSILFFSCGESPVDQDALIAAVAAVNPNTVVVLNTAGPVEMPWLSKVDAVLETWYPGQQNGQALARLLYGDVNPSGKLPQTFPKKLRDLPVRTPEQYPGVKRVVRYTEGLLVGYRWFDQRRIAPLFPFGHGLSYTEFRYSRLRVTPRGDGATVRFTLRNVGRAGRGRGGAGVRRRPRARGRAAAPAEGLPTRLPPAGRVQGRHRAARPARVLAVVDAARRLGGDAGPVPRVGGRFVALPPAARWHPPVGALRDAGGRRPVARRRRPPRAAVRRQPLDVGRGRAGGGRPRVVARVARRHA